MSQTKRTLKKSKSISNRRRILNHKIRKIKEFRKITINSTVEVLSHKMKDLTMLSVLSLLKNKKLSWLSLLFMMNILLSSSKRTSFISLRIKSLKTCSCKGRHLQNKKTHMNLANRFSICLLKNTIELFFQRMLPWISFNTTRLWGKTKMLKWNITSNRTMGKQKNTCCLLSFQSQVYHFVSSLVSLV